MKCNKCILALLFLAAAPAAIAGTAPADSLSAAVEDGNRTVTLTLEQCRELALQNSRDILNASLDVEAAKAQKQEAVAEYFPKVAVTAIAFYAFDPLLELGITDIIGNSEFAENLNNTLTQLATQYGFSPVYSTLKKGVSANVSVMQPVFAGGRIVTGNKLAKLGIEAAGLQQSISLRTTVEDVESAYWQIVSLENKLDCLSDVRTMLDTLYRDVLSASDAGLALETDLLQVRLKMNEVKAGEVQLKNGIRLAKMNFFNSIGVEYNPYSTFSGDGAPGLDDIRLTDDISDISAPQEYYRPAEEVAADQEETKLLDLSVESKRLEKRMALGEALPQIAVGATYGYNNVIDKGSMDGLVFGMIRIPLSDWGKTARKMQRLDTQMQKAENDRLYLQRQLVLQVHKLWLDATAAWEKLLVAEESCDMAEALMKQMEAKYSAGMAAVSDLLQAQTQFTQAEADLLDCRIAYRTALRAYRDKAE